MGYEMHHILSKEDGEKLQRDAERKLGKQMNKVKKVEEAVAELEAIAKLDNRCSSLSHTSSPPLDTAALWRCRGLRRVLTDNLIKKYCYLVRPNQPPSSSSSSSLLSCSVSLCFSLSVLR
jgi:hypothetical protein